MTMVKKAGTSFAKCAGVCTADGAKKAGLIDPPVHNGKTVWLAQDRASHDFLYDYLHYSSSNTPV